jgi:hypothetical protein
VRRNPELAIVVTKTAETRLGCGCSNDLDSPMDRIILVQSQMGPHVVVIGGILAKDAAQASLTEHDQVVESFSPDRADQSLRIPVLPWRHFPPQAASPT